MEQKLNHVWARIGVLLSVSPEEMETLMRGNYDDAQKILLKNNQYGTSYEDDDVDMGTDSFPHNKLRLEIVKEESV